MFDKIAYYYAKGIYKRGHLEIFLARGVITQAQFDELVGVGFKG